MAASCHSVVGVGQVADGLQPKAIQELPFAASELGCRDKINERLIPFHVSGFVDCRVFLSVPGAVLVVAPRTTRWSREWNDVASFLMPGWLHVVQDPLVYRCATVPLGRARRGDSKSLSMEHHHATLIDQSLGGIAARLR